MSYEIYDFSEKQAEWSMETGYVAVRSLRRMWKSSRHIQKRTRRLSFRSSSDTCVHPAGDPTGGKIYDALEIACDQVEIENVPAQEALDEAQATAQAALDEVNGN